MLPIAVNEVADRLISLAVLVAATADGGAGSRSQASTIKTSWSSGESWRSILFCVKVLAADSVRLNPMETTSEVFLMLIPYHDSRRVIVVM